MLGPWLREGLGCTKAAKKRAGGSHRDIKTIKVCQLLTEAGLELDKTPGSRVHGQ